LSGFDFNGIIPAIAVPFNDAGAMERRIERLIAEGRAPACVIMEAAMMNLGVVLPQPGYLEQVREINLFATGGLAPDRTLLLAISPAAGRARQDGRGQEPDRLEREDAAFFAAVADAYDRLARQEPDRIRTIDATGAPAEVLAAALAALADLIPSG